jgi:hypothetical protein
MRKGTEIGNLNLRALLSTSTRPDPVQVIYRWRHAARVESVLNFM